MSTWVGIIFLIGSMGTYGLNDEYFNSKEACWEYFDMHPSFELLSQHTNHYHIHAKVKKYEVEEVGTAYVTCKEKMHNETISPWPTPTFDPAEPYQHKHDHNHDS